MDKISLAGDLGSGKSTVAQILADILKAMNLIHNNEITEIARKIDTFETSILPYEDCCTVFTPAHPTTNPKLANIEKSESRLDFDGLVEKALEANNEKLSKNISEDVGEQVIKEMNYLFREQEEAEEERFRHLDEAIRTNLKKTSSVKQKFWQKKPSQA